MKIFFIFLFLALPHFSHGNVLKVALSEFPPYSSKNLQGQGITPYYFKQFAKASGIDVSFQFVPYARSIHNLKHESFSGIFVLKASLPNIESNRSIITSEPVASIKHCFLYLKSNAKITFDHGKELKKLSKLSIFTTNLNPMIRHLKKHNIPFNYLSGYRGGIKMLLAKRIDLYAFELRAYKFMKGKLSKEVGCLRTNFSDQLVFAAPRTPKTSHIIRLLNQYLKKHSYNLSTGKYLKKYSDLN